MEKWKELMLESQGRLNIIQKIFKWLINISKIRERLSGKLEEARFQVREINLQLFNPNESVKCPDSQTK